MLVNCCTSKHVSLEIDSDLSNLRFTNGCYKESESYDAL